MNNPQRKLRRENLARLVYLAEHPDFDTNPNIRAEWERLKGGNEYPSPNTVDVQVEVLHEGEVIFTGRRAEVRKEFGISHSNLSRKLRENRPDRKQRYYRIKN
ncbi:hypothetical protein FQS90_12360 [Enterococcus casseliflavus]|uniref:hypothetical protein n=1 Tax=Enterococcus sp. 8E11_MSG4843 TaxID=1834190 RepID=UPI000B3E6B2E|nr:hypothetical protein [Enterococcus sp. 8E11_MSG4843]MBO1097312.1 hypothetical protein [Enterococcus casseliflavus]MBO1144437.1 hypothetical protein [Enterococcus casseliflavus]OUZ36129.1 hypothetical protein A5885_000314 [Enterococcus sp. 8E11_MSG4843]